NSQPLRRASNSRTDGHRHDAGRRHPQATPARRAPTGAANGRRAAVQQPDGAASLLEIRTTGRGTRQVSGVGARSPDRVPGVEFGTAPSGQSRPLYRLERGSASAQHPLHCLQYSFSHSALGSRSASGVAPSRPHGSGPFRRLAADVQPPDLLRGNLHRSRTLPWNLLPRRQLATAWPHHRARQKRPKQPAEPPHQGNSRFALDTAFPRVSQPVMTRRRRVDVNLDELDQIIGRSTREPLSQSEGQKLKIALHAMAERLLRKRSTEKTSAVLPPDA